MGDLLRRLIPRSFSAQCGYALVLGVLLGVGFGPRIAFLKPVGDILARVTMLLVLPYLVFELTGLFGSLGTPALRTLLRGGGLLFGFGLLVAGTEIVLLPLILPDLPYSPPFDPRLLETPARESLLEAFLPDNIFEALSHGNFTAIVLFSATLGLTLQRLDRKEEILAVVLPIRRLFTEFFVLALDLLTPVGILAIVAVSIGTQDPADAQKLAGLFWMCAASLLVNGVVLYPGLYLACTSFGLRAMSQILRDPVIVSLTTGNILLALPILCRNLERFILATREGDADQKPTIDGLTAIASLGLLVFAIGEHLNLLFLPFAAWFKGTPLSVEQTLRMLVTALPASLGAPGAAIAEGLGKLNLPREMLNLYFVVSDWITRIGCIETLISITAGVLMLLAAERRRLRFRIPMILGTLVVSIVVGLGAGFLGNRMLTPFLGDAGTSPDLILGRPSLLQKTPLILLETPPPPALPGNDAHAAGRRLQAGIVTNSPPWVFLNRHGDWVGFDVDLLKSISRMLDVQLELLPGSLSDLEGLLASNRIDCVVGGIGQGSLLQTPAQRRIDYKEVPLALLVRDKDIRDRVARLDSNSNEEIRVAVVRTGGDRATELVVRSHLTRPETRLRVRFVPIDGVMDFIKADQPPADVLLTSAEAGSSLAILHPDHSMLPVFGNDLRLRLVFLISDRFPGGVEGAEDLMSQATALGVQRRLVDHWFRLLDPEGGDATP